MLWGKEKYLLNSLHEQLENKVSLKHINSEESVSSKDKQIKGQTYSSKFLNSIKL